MKKSKNDLIMDEFRKSMPLLETLEEVVVGELTQRLKMRNEQESGQLVSSVGLYLLCQARLVWGDKNERQLLQYHRRTSRNDSQAERRTNKILALRQQKGVKQ